MSATDLAHDGNDDDDDDYDDDDDDGDDDIDVCLLTTVDLIAHIAAVIVRVAHPARPYALPITARELGLGARSAR